MSRFDALGLGDQLDDMFGQRAPDPNALIRKHGDTAVGQSIVWDPMRSVWVTRSFLGGERLWDLADGGRFVEHAA